jgi:hypothetical protein
VTDITHTMHIKMELITQLIGNGILFHMLSRDFSSYARTCAHFTIEL